MSFIHPSFEVFAKSKALNRHATAVSAQAPLDNLSQCLADEKDGQAVPPTYADSAHRAEPEPHTSPDKPVQAPATVNEHVLVVN